MMMRGRKSRTAGQSGSEALFRRRCIAASKREFAQQGLGIGPIRYLAPPRAAQDRIGLVQRVAADRGAGIEQLLAIGGAVQCRLPLRRAAGVGGDGAFQQAAGIGIAALAQADDAQTAQRIRVGRIGGERGLELPRGIPQVAGLQAAEPLTPRGAALGCSARRCRPCTPSSRPPCVAANA